MHFFLFELTRTLSLAILLEFLVRKFHFISSIRLFVTVVSFICVAAMAISEPFGKLVFATARMHFSDVVFEEFSNAMNDPADVK